jgi:hypothetical protein
MKFLVENIKQIQSGVSSVALVMGMPKLRGRIALVPEFYIVLRQLQYIGIKE